MRQRLAELFQVPADLDYVEGFQALSLANLEIRKHGPSVERLLRKSLLERAVGNHAASLSAAQRARELDPGNAEAHYEVALAYFYLALMRAEAVPVGPKQMELPTEGIGELLGLAVEAFCKVVEINPLDEDAAQDLAALAEILAVGADDEQIGAALRAR